MQDHAVAPSAPPDANDLEAPSAGAWPEVCDALRKTVGDDAFQRWFRAAEWAGEEDGAALISVPGAIHQVWIETNFLAELRMAVNSVHGHIREVRMIVSGNGAADSSPHNGHTDGAAPKTSVGKSVALEGEALDRRIKATGLNPGFTF
ncbi:MAG: DnaA N-terminal domain-containing protein, partial [Luteolibacter sp.]